ncbi:ribonuclease III [Clostridium swellfunianum]|uniref:ribonuclease III n=1 Tax=Clostridium swellfunianum TaxID=1367462 RepID=UPI00202F4647|nr:ribonuclease III [Clostridium swellfunianum]MCM0648704.1 ribonuclease III [Clostridium swellfunianum]
MKVNLDSMKELEEKLNIKFNNKKIIAEALTHSSFVNQNKDLNHNERLEFLGDSILQLTISEHLYKNYTDKTEGELTRTRALIVCENSLYEIAQKLNVGKYMYMSKGEELTGGRDRVSILADCVEAIIAAIYMDCGLEEAKKFIVCNFENIIKKAISNEIVLDYKTKLQEELQQNGEVSISYKLIRHEGPPHRRKFFTEILVGDKILGVGAGYSKKEAEQNAAKDALMTLEV